MRKLVRSRILRGTLIFLGWLATAGGVIGLFLPLIPTVPLLLLAALCFSRSSERFHTWLVEHKHLGAPIRDFLAHRALPLKAKVLGIGMIWVSIPTTAILVLNAFWLKALLLAIALAVSVYLWSLPTLAPCKVDAKAEE